MSQIDFQQVPQRLMNDVLEKTQAVNGLLEHIRKNGHFAIDCTNEVLGRKVNDLYQSTAIALARTLGDGWKTAEVIPGSDADMIRQLHQAAFMFASGNSVLLTNRNSGTGMQLVEAGRDALMNTYKQLERQTVLHNNSLEGMRFPPHPSK